MTVPADGAVAITKVPTSSSAIQAGEPANISMANTSWKRLTIFRPGRPMKNTYCSVPWQPAQVAPDVFDQGRRVLLPAEILVRQDADVEAGAPHQGGLDLVVAENLAAQDAACRAGAESRSAA